MKGDQMMRIRLQTLRLQTFANAPDPRSKIPGKTSWIQEPEDPRLNPGDEVLLFVYYDMSSIPGVLLRSFPWNLGSWILRLLDPRSGAFANVYKLCVCKR